MRFKAVFFDNDGTLVYNNPENESWRNQIIEKWSNKPFDLPYEKFISVFNEVHNSKKPYSHYKNVDDEILFFKDFYKILLQREGVGKNIEERSALLFNRLWGYRNYIIHSETLFVLDYLKKNNYRMGIISDTSPSLQYRIEGLGLGCYFESYSASSLVGAGKPNPKIFNHALKSLGVKAEDCIYVDDTKIEADGARKLGFTSFHLDRKSESSTDIWTISDLTAIVNYIEINKNK